MLDKILIALALTCTLVNGEPPRAQQALRNSGIRNSIGFFARHEEVPATIAEEYASTDAAAGAAPYAPAGVTPEIPFELPTETEAPTVAQPDQTYGPPDDTYGTPAPDAENRPAAPTNTYGPPDGVQQVLAGGDNDAATDLVSQNLIQPRNQRLRYSPSSLRAPSLRLTVAPRTDIVEILRSEPVIIYTLH